MAKYKVGEIVYKREDIQEFKGLVGFRILSVAGTGYKIVYHVTNILDPKPESQFSYGFKMEITDFLKEYEIVNREGAIDFIDSTREEVNNYYRSVSEELINNHII